MTPSPVVDEIAAAVRDDPSGPNLVRLWEAVYALEHWWLLPTGTAGDPRPLVGVVGEHRYLLAFTGRHHVATFAGARDGAGAAGATAALTITPADLTGLATVLAAGGIAGVLFDRGVHDLVAPITGLPSMWTRFGEAA
jgi:hypothetical protein